jgi:hypothetical protein
MPGSRPGSLVQEVLLGFTCREIPKIVKVGYSLDEPLDIRQSPLTEVMLTQFTGKIIKVMINLPGV